MTREEMVKRSFKPYMILIFHDRDKDVEMMLLAAHFDNEVFTLSPVDTDFYEDESITVSISKVSFPKKVTKMKVLKT